MQSDKLLRVTAFSTFLLWHNLFLSTNPEKHILPFKKNTNGIITGAFQRRNIFFYAVPWKDTLSHCSFTCMTLFSVFCVVKEQISVFSFQNEGRALHGLGACPTCQNWWYTSDLESHLQTMSRILHYYELTEKNYPTTAFLPLHLLHYHHGVHLNKELPYNGHCTSLEYRWQSWHILLTPAWSLVSFMMLSVIVSHYVPQRSIDCNSAHVNSQCTQTQRAEQLLTFLPRFPKCSQILCFCVETKQCKAYTTRSQCSLRGHFSTFSQTFSLPLPGLEVKDRYFPFCFLIR